MNIEKTMILIKGEDKTNCITDYEYDIVNKKINITYNNGKKYKYNICNVIVLENPTKIDLNDEVIYINGNTFCQHSIVLDFVCRIRIILKNGSYKTVKPENVSFVKNGCCDKVSNDILRYLREVSIHTSKNSEGETFLGKEMEELKFVHPKSVLCSYLNSKHINKQTYDVKDIIFPFSFNLSQKEALKKAMENSISIIEGPPGTGKTQTILNLLSNIVAIQNKSVAVVSSNNEAVKNVIDKMDKKGYGFLTALLGNKGNKETFFENISSFEVNEKWNCSEDKNILIDKINKLNVKLEELLVIDRKRAIIKQELQAWRLEQQHFLKYSDNKNIENIEKLPILKSNLDKIMSYMAESSLALEKGISKKIIHNIIMFLKFGFSHIKLSKDKANSLLFLEKSFYEMQIENLEKEINSLENKLEYEEFEKILNEHQVNSEKLFKKCLYEYYNKIERCDFNLKNYKANFDQFIKAYPIILSTTHALKKSIPDNYLLDYVIIDEASQVDLITGVLTFSCCKNVIIVGDTKQLPQITDSNIENKIKSKINLDEYNYFNHSILSSVISLYKDDLSRVVLKEHYRCHPKIIGFCNQKYYNGELIPYTNYDLSEEPLILYRSSPGNHMRNVTRGDNKGKYNQRELDITIQEVLCNNNVNIDYKHIGFVTPYRKQANVANSVLPNQIQSDTVHKYQGREKDLMIMSTVIDNSYMGSMGLEFVDDSNMVNVAVSRAVKQFILVTDHDLFYKKGNNIGDLIRYIQYNTLDKNIIDSKIVSVFDLLYKRYSEKLIYLKSKMKENAKFKSEEIIRVLLEEIFYKNGYNRYTYSKGVILYNLLNSLDLLDSREKSYVKNGASLDFVIYNKQDKSCKLVIEVDGFAFHENNPEQLVKDRLKDSILEKYDIPLLRLKTNGSGEEEKIMKALE